MKKRAINPHRLKLGHQLESALIRHFERFFGGEYDPIRVIFKSSAIVTLYISNPSRKIGRGGNTINSFVEKLRLCTELILYTTLIEGDVFSVHLYGGNRHAISISVTDGPIKKWETNNSSYHNKEMV